jgi:hypothetical protein
MPKGDRIFSMILEVKSGVLIENLIATEDDGTGPKAFPHKKLHKRATKVDARNLMKDPSKFAISELGDSNHPTIIMRETPGAGAHDEVSFYHFEGFTVFFNPHPEVIEENESSPEGPYTNGGGTVVTFEAATDQGGAPRVDKFKAGPYHVAANAKNQKFWKFSIVTASGLTLDPCIIIEP